MCESHCGQVAIYIIKKGILRQKKKNYGNSNIFHHAKNIINRQKIPLNETKILQDIIITL